MLAAVVPARGHHPAVLVVQVALLRLGVGVLVPRVPAVHRVAQRVGPDEHLLVGPVVVVRAAEQDADAEVDRHQVGGDELAVHHHARGDEHLPAPVGHVLVREVAVLGVLEGAPAAEQGAAQADLLVPGQRLVEEVEEVVVHRHDLLHELDVAHQPGDVVGHQLDRGHRADAAGVQSGRMDVPALHEAEHLPRPPGHLQRLPVELAGERVERPHDVGDRAVAVVAGVRRLGVLGAGEHPGVGLGDHPLAVVHPDQVLLEDVVVEHVLGGLAEVDDPLPQVRRLHAVGHVLRVAGAGGVVVPADAADPAGDEVRVPRVLALHEERVAAEDRRRALALGDRPVREVDLRVDAEAADDPGDRVPGHLDQVARAAVDLAAPRFGGGHQVPLPGPLGAGRAARRRGGATSAPCPRSWLVIARSRRTVAP